jgi:hypothetical protein
MHEMFRKLPERKGLAVRYITKVVNTHFVITRATDGTISGESPGQVKDLLRYLEKPTGGMVQTVVDPAIYGLERMREMLRLWMPGQVQIFVSKTRPTASIHMIDEAGNFYNDRVEIAELDMTLKSVNVFLSSLGQAPLPFAANRDGKLKFASQEIINISEIESKYEYRLTKYASPQETMVMRKFMFVSIVGPLDMRSPHLVTLRTPGNQEEYKTREGNLVVELARIVGDGLERLRCAGFAIIELRQTGGDSRCRQTIEYLALRRSVDLGLRKLLAANNAYFARQVSAAGGTNGGAPSSDSARLAPVEA